MIVLGIETSCDETGIGILQYNENCESKILSNIIKNNLKEHSKYGGIHPQTAARDHLEYIDGIYKIALKQASIEPEQIDLIAVTQGPGLVGSLLIGSVFAKTLAMSLNKNIVYVNHLEGHILCPILENYGKIKFPFCTLLVSGGHTEIIHTLSVRDYKILGRTKDDALGEVFDKVGRALGLEYPAGAMVEKLAKNGKKIIDFPINVFPKSMNFSFSGIKTAVMRAIQNIALEKLHQNASYQDLGDHSIDITNGTNGINGNSKDNFSHLLNENEKCDIAHSFLHSVTIILIKKISIAIKETNTKTLIVSGGVAANMYIREKIIAFCKQHDCECFFPEIDLCTDNGIMIAIAGAMIFSNNLKNNEFDDIRRVNTRWKIEKI